ncbi:MAG: POTRA domain-containing protein [Bacteroidia bacterium]
MLPAKLKYVVAVAFLLFFPSSPFLAQSDSISRTYSIVDSIVITGNKITKASIILRELDFKSGDTLSESDWGEKAEQGRKNLLNTSLFNFVEITSSFNPSEILTNRNSPVAYQRLCIHIALKERWYTWPIPIFELYERNFNTWYLHPTLNKLDYGFYLNRYNFLGRKQTLSFTFRLGYLEQFGITYTIPYLNKRKKSGLMASVVYSRSKEIPYINKDNLFIFYRDDAHPVRQEQGARITYTYRHGFYQTWFVEGRYTRATVQDTLKYLNGNYFLDQSGNMQYLTLTAGYIADHRDSKPYPIKGYYVNASLNRNGLGLLPGEQADVWSLNLMLRRYIHLGGRFYAGSAFKGRYTGRQQVPFYLESTLGYRDYIRGYEYYVMQGQSFGMLKNVVRYQIVKPHVQKIPYLPLEKFNTFHYAFYADIFADLGYVQNFYDRPEMGNTFDNSWLYGYGTGIDFVTYYDFVLRAEFALNQRGEYGFFLHLNSPL